MAKVIDAKIRLKRSTNDGDVPTVAPSNDHLDGTWDALDIYVGEPYVNVNSDRFWIRTDNGIIEVPFLKTNQAGEYRFSTASGTDTYTATLTPTLTEYGSGGALFAIKFTNANTGAATININGLGAKGLKKNGSALASGDIGAGKTYLLIYDGTNFQVLGLASGGGITNSAANNYVTKSDGTNLVQSQIYDNGTFVGVAGATYPTDASEKFQILVPNNSYGFAQTTGSATVAIFSSNAGGISMGTTTNHSYNFFANNSTPQFSILPDEKNSTTTLISKGLSADIGSGGNPFRDARFSRDLYLSGLAADKALYIDADNIVSASATTATQLGYLSNVTSDVQAQINALNIATFWKDAVRVATTTAGTLASSFENGDTIDGVVLVTGDRILIKNQTDAKENGIYTVNASGAPTRATDFDADADKVAGATVRAQEGTENADKVFNCTTDAPVTFGVDDIDFIDMGGTTYIGTADRITVSGNVIDISSSYDALWQPVNSNLTTIAGLTATTDNFIVSVGSAWASRTPSQVRSTLGLVIGTNVQAWDADLDSWAAITRASGFDTFVATPSSANLAALITDETGSGALVFGTSPTFTTDIRTPLAIGGTAVGSTLTLQSTTGNGTSTGAGVVVNVGNNGASNALTIYNDKQFIVGGSTRMGGSIGMFRVETGTLATDIGQSGTSSYLWMGLAVATTPTTSNFIIRNDATSSQITYFNSPASNMELQLNGTRFLSADASQTRFYGLNNGTASATTFSFEPQAGSNITAGTEKITFNLKAATLTHASNTAVTTQRYALISAPTYAFASATGTITDCVAFEVAAPIAGTNAAITRNWASRLLGNVAIGGSAYIGDATGTTAPTALLHLAAGTATASTAPLKLTTGTLNTTAEAGAFEYLTNALFFTPTASTRGVVGVSHYSLITSDVTLANSTSAQSPLASTADVFTAPASTSYEFELLIYVTCGTTSRNVSLSFDGGSATYTDIEYLSRISSGIMDTVSTTTYATSVTAATATQVTNNFTTQGFTMMVKGIIRVNGTGTIIPQITFSADPTGTILSKKGGYFKLTPLGSNTVASIGNWA